MERLDRAAALIAGSGRLIVAVTLAGLFLALFVNVLLRYLAGDGLEWAYELHSIAFPWMIAGGMAAAAAAGRNIAVTLLPDMLGAGARRALLIAVYLILAFISVAVLVSARPIIMASRFQVIQAFGVSQFWGYLSLVYGFGAVAILALIEALRLALGGADRKTEAAHGSLS